MDTARKRAEATSVSQGRRWMKAPMDAYIASLLRVRMRPYDGRVDEPSCRAIGGHSRAEAETTTGAVRDFVD
jgi:hypothetical protein